MACAPGESPLRQHGHLTRISRLARARHPLSQVDHMVIIVVIGLCCLVAYVLYISLNEGKRRQFSQAKKDRAGKYV